MMKSMLKELMAAKGETYRSMIAAGFQSQTIRNAIRQIEKSNMPTLCKLADYFGVCVSDLFDDGCGPGV